MASSCIDAYSKDLSSTSTPSLLPSISVLAHGDEQIVHTRNHRASIPPPSPLPPEPRSFSSNCSNRRSGAPPLPPALLSTANKHIHLSPTGINTPLTALSIGEEQSPGILTPLRRFPLPPAGGNYRQDNDRTPTLPTFEEEEEEEGEQNQRQATDQHRRTAIMRLPGALASLDSLDSSYYNTQAPDFRNSAAHSTAAASIYDDSLEEDNRPATPRSNRIGGRRHSSSSCHASPDSRLQSSPYSLSAAPSRTRRKGARGHNRQSSSSHSQTSTKRKGMKHKQSRTSLTAQSRRDEHVKEDTFTAGEQQQSTRNAATRQSSYHSSRPTSRAASWRSRYSRPETAMSTATTAAETVYEDALDGFEADEEAEEPPVHARVRPSISDRRPSLNLTLSTSSSLSSDASTVRKSRFRLSFQRRRAESPLYASAAVAVASGTSTSTSTTTSTHRPSSIQTRPDSGLSGSESHPLHRQDSNSARTTSAWKRSSTAPMRYTPDLLLSSSSAVSTSASASSVDDKRLSGTTSGALSPNKLSHQSGDAIIYGEIITDKERAASPSSTSSLRPLMLTLETTRRGSLKDWMVQSGSKSLPSLPDHEVLTTRALVQEANENPYAQIYEELAKSPELKSVSELPSPPSAPLGAQQQPSYGPAVNVAASSSLSSSSYLKQVQHLPPLAEIEAEESYIDAEESMNNNSSLLRELSALNLLPGTSTASQGEISAELSDRSAAGIALSTDSPPVKLRQRSIDRGSSRNNGSRYNKDWIGIPSPSSFTQSARSRTISSSSTSVSKPMTTTSTSNSITANTASGTPYNSAEYATVETGLTVTNSSPTPFTRHTPRSPISSRFLQAVFEQDLKDFFKLDDMQGRSDISGGSKMIRTGLGSLPPPAATGPFGKSSFDDVKARSIANNTNDATTTASRKRTQSQPVSSQALKKAYNNDNNNKAFTPLPFPSQGTTGKDSLHALPTPKESILSSSSSTWILGRKIKISNARKITKAPLSPSPQTPEQSSSFPPAVNGLGLLSTMKKRKSTPDINKLGFPKSSGAQNTAMRSLRSIRNIMISAPLQAEHICTGALNPHPNRESPFGRRPSSPVQGYIDVPGQTSSLISGSLFLEDFDTPSGAFDAFNAIDPSASASNSLTSSGSRSRSRSSPSQDRTSATSTSTFYNSPITFSSPISSTSSHSWDGPDTPSIITANPYTAATTSATRPASNGGQDFWAVDFAVAQSGDNDFIAPHASLVKASSKLALLSTNEKARRRASKASMPS